MAQNIDAIGAQLANAIATNVQDTIRNTIRDVVRAELTTLEVDLT